MQNLMFLPVLYALAVVTPMIYRLRIVMGIYLVGLSFCMMTVDVRRKLSTRRKTFLLRH